MYVLYVYGIYDTHGCFVCQGLICPHPDPLPEGEGLLAHPSPAFARAGSNPSRGRGQNVLSQYVHAIPRTWMKWRRASEGAALERTAPCRLCLCGYRGCRSRLRCLKAAGGGYRTVFDLPDFDGVEDVAVHVEVLRACDTLVVDVLAAPDEV